MIPSLHGVFAVSLLLVLLWDAFATRRPRELGGMPLERVVLLPLVALCAAVLLRDRLHFGEPAWLEHPLVQGAFVAALVLGVAQNVSCMRTRGLRPTDVPIVLHNLALLALLPLSALTMHGVVLGRDASAWLHDHSVLQLLLGTPLAQTWTLSWHLPLFTRRGPVTSIPQAIVGLLPAAYATFVVVIPLLFHDSSLELMDTFDAEPRLEHAPRADLHVGVFTRADVPFASSDGDAHADVPPGDLDAWVLPADRDPHGLPTARRALVLELAAPFAWNLALPDVATRRATFLDGAERLAAALRPALMLAVPEPDGETSLLFPPDWTPDDWTALAREARSRVRAVSPSTRLAVRLAGTGPRSEALFLALVDAGDALDVAGPRLAPAGLAPGGAGISERILDTWDGWLRASAVPRVEGGPARTPPAFWILAAGASPLAFGHAAQTRFLEGVLARADARGTVAGLLVDGWRDLDHTCGLLGADGAPRPAGAWLERTLAGR